MPTDSPINSPLGIPRFYWEPSDSIRPKHALVSRRQPSHREFDLPVGKLTPILDDGHVPAGGICIEDLARLWAGLRDRQRKRLTYEAIAFKFATVPLIARLICNISRSLNARSPTDQT